MLLELSEPSQVVERPEGSLRIWSVRPGLIITQATGRMLSVHAESIMAAVDSAVLARPGEAVGVHDWLAVESYEVAVHATMSAWAVRAMRSMRRVVIGVHSPFVAMAVRTVNLAVGGRFEVSETHELLLTAARAELARR